MCMSVCSLYNVKFLLFLYMGQIDNTIFPPEKKKKDDTKEKDQRSLKALF